MPASPLVSVLVPMFQHEASVGRALASLQAQTLDDLEIIVVDDGSSDGGAERVASLSTKDSRIRLLRQDHGGIVAALRRAVGEARGEFIARMDADDWSAPERLARQVALLRAEPSLGAVDCQVTIRESDVTGDGMRRYVAWLNGLDGASAIRNALFEESPLVHPATTMTRRALDVAGGYVDGPWPEDYSLWLRMAAAGYALGKVPEQLFEWSDPPGRVTRTDERCSQQAHLALKVAMLPRLVPSAAHGVQVWGAGATGRRLMRHLREADIPVVGLYDVSPKLIGRSLHGIRVQSVYELPKRSQPICLVALGQPRAKRLTREFLNDHGLVSWRDYLFVS